MRMSVGLRNFRSYGGELLPDPWLHLDLRLVIMDTVDGNPNEMHHSFTREVLERPDFCCFSLRVVDFGKFCTI